MERIRWLPTPGPTGHRVTGHRAPIDFERRIIPRGPDNWHEDMIVENERVGVWLIAWCVNPVDCPRAPSAGVH
eukprot:scaffold88365_cov27-Tisochrysis_lutea.AAC.1